MAIHERRVAAETDPFNAKIPIEIPFGETGLMLQFSLKPPEYNRVCLLLLKRSLVPSQQLSGVTTFIAFQPPPCEVAELKHSKEQNIPEEFLQIYTRYYPVVKKFFSVKLRNTYDNPDDYTQKVFLRVIKHLADFKPDEDQSMLEITVKGEVITSVHKRWILTIARNFLKNTYRDMGRVREETISDLMIEGEDASQEEVFARLSISTDDLPDTEETNPFLLMYVLNNVLPTLTDIQRAIFWLKIVESFKNKEIGEVFDMTEGAIKTAYSRIMKLIRSETKEINGSVITTD